MNKSDWSYLITAIFFTIGFIGFAFSINPGFYIAWLAALGLGIVSFCIRILAGHD